MIDETDLDAATKARLIAFARDAVRRSAPALKFDGVHVLCYARALTP